MRFQDRERRTYRPGHKVPNSGVYLAIHRDHRAAHEVVAIQGEEFPSCRICKNEVRFYSERVVPHMTHDFDLTGPESGALKPRAKAAGTE